MSYLKSFPILLPCIAVLLFLFAAPGAISQEIGRAPIKSFSAFTIGTPGVFNISHSQFVGTDLGFRLTAGYAPGGYGGHAAGGQVNVLWRVKETYNTFMDVTVLGGYTEFIYADCCCEDDKYWRYVGAGGSIKWRALFVEGALSVGSGSFSSPQALLQIGVVFKTRRR